ncbi:MAG: succinate dehydrogenase assembly factor 2 [Robiginitomaculum sp.]
MQKNRIKRIIHRSHYRGFKEADLILGGFAKAHACELTKDELGQFETLMDEKDHDIYDWISGAQNVPTRHNTAFFAKLKNYKPKI